MSINLNSRRAKIVCTLGPSSNSYETIRDLALAGMDVARLNFSHGSYEDHLERIKIIRKVSEDIDKPIAILQDLQGPKIRVGTFQYGKVTLNNGAKFNITVEECVGNEERVSTSYKSIVKDVKEGDIVLLDDGILKLKVLEVTETDVVTEVVFGGVLKDRKGINLPDVLMSVPALSEKDIADVEFGLKNEVDYIALSFVQRADDVLQLKRIITNAGYDTPIVAKIEKPQAVHSLDAITDVADAIMVARGDLGVELNTEDVPPTQKKIIKMCNQKGVPVITATQMLESMIHNPRPTRAEASDVANAILDGTDAVMLSAETAAGAFPIEAVQTMAKIITIIENYALTNTEQDLKPKNIVYSAPLAIGYAACNAANMVNASAIVCMTQSGSTAVMISKFRPKKPIIAVTARRISLLRLCLVWGVQGYLIPGFKDNVDDAVEEMKQSLIKEEIVRQGNRIIITAGLPFTKRRSTNMMRIEEI
ncbi:MAG: pyruvate kinase [Bacteroidetes bacterium]|nr:pyruvate kinase [Bacteroidota bacterium]